MAENKKMGRPPKLTADEATLNTVKGLGQIQATTKECAAVLNVSEPTYLKFKADHPEVADAYENGLGNGRASLRRRQFKAAEAGNATMLVWLGKQYLGQADKHDHEVQHDLSDPMKAFMERIATNGKRINGNG